MKEKGDKDISTPAYVVKAEGDAIRPVNDISNVEDGHAYEEITNGEQEDEHAYEDRKM